MRMRIETIAFLKWLDQQETHVSATDAARMLGMTYDSVRKRLARLEEASMLGIESRWTRQGRKMDYENYYHVLAHTRAKLARYPHVEAMKPREARGPNSVFQLGAHV